MIVFWMGVMFFAGCVCKSVFDNWRMFKWLDEFMKERRNAPKPIFEIDEMVEPIEAPSLGCSRRVVGIFEWAGEFYYITNVNGLHFAFTQESLRRRPSDW